MTLKIIPTPEFSKVIKILSKDYKKVVNDLEVLKSLLSVNPKSGTSLGDNCYKIRLANTSIPTGKRGGFRVITYFIDDQNTIRLLLIYSKRDQENISDKDLQEVIRRNIP